MAAMTTFVILSVLALVIGITAYAFHDYDGQLPNDWTSL
jgi:hypothetical protein